MGGAFVAVPGDVNALHYNPAGISFINQRAVSFSYQDDLLDLNSGFVGYVEPHLGPGNLGAAVLYRDYGQFTRTDISGQEQGSFGAGSLALSVSYAVSPLENLSFGGTAKYIRSTIDDYSADGMAADVAVMYRIPVHDLVFAAGVFNVGAQINAFISEKYPLPLLMRAGFAKRLAHLPLLFAANVYKYNDSPWYFSLGGEFTLTEGLFLRFGYDGYGRDLGVDSSKDTLAGAAVGMGFVRSSFSFDYAYTSLGVLGSLNRFTISGRF